MAPAKYQGTPLIQIGCVEAQKRQHQVAVALGWRRLPSVQGQALIQAIGRKLLAIAHRHDAANPQGRASPHPVR